MDLGKREEGKGRGRGRVSEAGEVEGLVGGDDCGSEEGNGDESESGSENESDGGES